MPRLLNEDQKERFMPVCEVILECGQIEQDLLRRVNTGDDTWIFWYVPET